MAELVTLEGLPELKAALERKSVEIRAAAEAAVAAEAELVAGDVRRNAPYLDGNPPDGHIRDSVHVEPEGLHAVVSVKNRHGAFVEFGTSKDAAQPYVQPAAEAARASFAARVESEVKGAIG